MKLRKLLSLSLAGTMLIAATAFTVPTAAASTIDDGLVAHWSFDGDLKDSSGNGLDAESDSKTIKFEKGIHGKAAVFKGEQCAIVPNSELLELKKKVSISFWAYLGDTENDSHGSVINKDCDINGSHNSYYEVSLYSSNTMETKLETENEYTYLSYCPDGCTWALYTATYDGKSLKLYQNGELIKKSNYSKGIGDIRWGEKGEGDLYIGYNPQGETYLSDALIDDLRLYDRALSYDEVGELYSAGVKANKAALEPKKDCVAYFSFDKNVKDNLGNVTATKVSEGGKFTLVDGLNGKAMQMTKGNYIEVAYDDVLNMKKNMTISYWAKPAFNGTAPIVYFENHAINDYANDYAYKTTLSCAYRDDGKYYLGDTEFNYYGYDPEYSWLSTNDYNYIDVSYELTDGFDLQSKWLHYTYVLSNSEKTGKSTIILYINGKQINKKEVTAAAEIGNASGSLLIGYGGEAFFEGALDELKIFNYALTKTEVAAEAKRVDSISLNKTDAEGIASIAAGKSYSISKILFNDVDENKSTEVKSTLKKVTFKSSDSKIFTVSSSGKLTAKKAGTAKLTITYGLQAVTYTVKVTK